MLSCERPSASVSLLHRKKLAVNMDPCLKRTGGRHVPRGPPRMVSLFARARVDVAEAGELGQRGAIDARARCHNASRVT
jgi:hypothetical protein